MSTTAPLIDGAAPGAKPPRAADAAPMRWDSGTQADRARMLRALPPESGVEGAAQLLPLGWSALPGSVRALICVSMDCEGEISKADRIELAALLGIHQGYLYQCLSGRTDMEASQAARAERITGLRRWRLRQGDWWDLWPELVGKPGAPARSLPAGNSSAAAAA